MCTFLSLGCVLKHVLVSWKYLPQVVQGVRATLLLVVVLERRVVAVSAGTALFCLFSWLSSSFLAVSIASLSVTDALVMLLFSSRFASSVLFWLNVD